MPYALYLDGDKVKEVSALPCIDQDLAAMNARMDTGYEWREIVEDPTPDHDPVYEMVTVTEAKTAGKKLRKTKKVWADPNWQEKARAVVNAKLETYFSFRALARDLVLRSNGPAITRVHAAVAHADSLLAAIDREEKPDLNAGWPV